MAQLVRKDACLDTFSDKLSQVNTCVGRITGRQAVIGDFTMATSPFLEASEDDDDDSDYDDVDEDEDATSPSDDEMST